MSDSPNQTDAPMDDETETLLYSLRDGGLEDIKALRRRIRQLIAKAVASSLTVQE